MQMPQGDPVGCCVYLLPAGYYPTIRMGVGQWETTPLSLDVIFREIRLFTGSTEKLHETKLFIKSRVL